MNEEERLVCCPECTTKYTSYHNMCPKCGAPKPATPNIVNVEERQNMTPTATKMQPVPNTTIQQPPTYIVPTPVPAPGYSQNYGQAYGQNYIPNYNYNNYTVQKPIDMQYETSKSIKNLMTLSTVVFVTTIVLSIILALVYLFSLGEYSLGGALLLIILVPGSCLLAGIILSQRLKWKALMLYHTQNNKCNCNNNNNNQNT